MTAVIAGGGWAGCAAATSARRAGINAVLLERTDMLLGTGLVGGIMRNNGRYTATEEMIAMGGGDLFTICDEYARHRDIEFPGHKHASLYDIAAIHNAVMLHLKRLGVDIVFNARVNKVYMKGGRIEAVSDGAERKYGADVFIDATGTAGPMINCAKYGNGCAMCILRCPSFGGRVSLTGLAGVSEMTGKKPTGETGAMSGSCKLFKESLSEDIQKRLNETGVALVPVPPELKSDKLVIKACQQYTMPEFVDNLVLLDTGHAKLMSPYYSLDLLRQIPGMENARYEDPYAGGRGNSMRYFEMAPRDDSLKVNGVDNLFCCGEKAGLLVGHTEAIVTGTLAGHNAAMYAQGGEALTLPETLATGYAVKRVREAMGTDVGMGQKFTFSGSVLYTEIIANGLYTTDIADIERRVTEAGLKGVFNRAVSNTKESYN
ncbi:MAG: FAD-dependent oxidoreductase [Clostridiales bacterium]|jgi:hypothetical protein|nr:FAD-dependent oxidoreductase [Clostridiales bacterium]